MILESRKSAVMSTEIFLVRYSLSGLSIDRIAEYHFITQTCRTI